MTLPSSLFFITLGLFSFGQALAELQVGEAAPDFELIDQNGESQSLEAYRGHWVVLYFYPKDDTPGCTTEACQFRDDYLQLTEMGAHVLGVSTDEVSSHQEFAEKYHLPFPLLSDAQGEVAKRYGSLFQIGPLRYAKRHSFIIDPQGELAEIYRDVNPKRHSGEVIARLATLMQESDSGKQ
ncbi:MAG: peroxiredoxin [Candidatus Thiodiazotropha sp.]